MTGEEIPRRRDRNWFFHLLSNGDQDTYERERPLWKQRRRLEKQVRNEKTAPDTPTIDLTSPRLPDLQRQDEKDKKAKVACGRLIRSSFSVRRRMRHARNLSNDDANRVALSQEEVKISKGLGKVREYASLVNELVPGKKPFDPNDLAKLHLRTDVDSKTRKRNHKEIKAVLGAFKGKVGVVRRDIRSRRGRYRQARAKEA